MERAVRGLNELYEIESLLKLINGSDGSYERWTDQGFQEEIQTAVKALLNAHYDGAVITCFVTNLEKIDAHVRAKDDYQEVKRLCNMSQIPKVDLDDAQEAERLCDITRWMASVSQVPKVPGVDWDEFIRLLAELATRGNTYRTSAYQSWQIRVIIRLLESYRPSQVIDEVMTLEEAYLKMQREKGPVSKTLAAFRQRILQESSRPPKEIEKREGKGRGAKPAKYGYNDVIVAFESPRRKKDSL